MRTYFCLAFFAVIASGCTWTPPTPTQSVAIDIHDAAGGAVGGVACRLANDQGTWHLVAPGTLVIAPSRVDLTVECDKPGAGSGFARVTSRPRPPSLDIRKVADVGALSHYTDPVRYPALAYPDRVLVRLGASVIVDGFGNVAAAPARRD